jgi:polyhydroxyalkanoate synthesis regulator phasin
MEPSEVAKQTLQFSKVTFDNTFNAMLLLQEQAQRIIDLYVNQMPVFSQEGKRIVDTWMGACKDNREEFKEALEKNYEIFISLFNEVEEESTN